jgi:hypothetical protein
MAKQPDMLGAKLDLKLPAREEPRLWVRRLVIWEALDKPAIRDVGLHPGLNVIWSPDGTTGEPNRSIGHGSGKTLFCRLLRYCLGENRFADENLRAKIATKFPDGWVGAEVMLDGVCWAVMRPLRAQQRHAAEADKTLDELRAAGPTNSGIDRLSIAIENTVLTRPTCDLMAGQKEHGRAWLKVLAWLARDQEARLTKPLAWRDASSESESPAVGLSELQKLDVVRALLKAITVEELTKRAEADGLGRKEDGLKAEIERLTWAINRAGSAAGEIPKASTPDPLGGLGDATSKKPSPFHVVPKVPIVEAERRATDARARYRDCAAAHARAREDVARLTTTIEEIPKRIAYLKGEGQIVQMAKFEAEHFICPICDVPIDRVLVDGCKLSHKVPDLEACKRRWAKQREDLARDEQELVSARARLKDALHVAAVAEAEMKKCEGALELAEQDHRSRFSAARQEAEAVSIKAMLPGLQRDRSKAQDDLAKVTAAKKKTLDQLAAMRETQNKRIQRIRTLYAVLVRLLIDDAETSRSDRILSISN